MSGVVAIYIPDASGTPRRKADHDLKGYDVNGLLPELDEYTVEGAPHIEGMTDGERC